MARILCDLEVPFCRVRPTVLDCENITNPKMEVSKCDAVNVRPRSHYLIKITIHLYSDLLTEKKFTCQLSDFQASSIDRMTTDGMDEIE